MWSFASKAVVGSKTYADCSDDEVSSCTSREEEGLECPICWESFNIVENVPYVLWCGHTLCKNCVLGLQWAVVKFPTVPVQLPLFISCPWCNTLSFRLLYKGALKFPRKNFFLLWMVESMNADLPKPRSCSGGHHSGSCPTSPSVIRASGGQHEDRVGGSSLRKSLAFFVRMTTKFPLVIMFLLIVLYAVPASAAVLALYVLVTVLFALPAFLMLYFAYPSLDWLVREIVA